MWVALPVNQLTFRKNSLCLFRHGKRVYTCSRGFVFSIKKKRNEKKKIIILKLINCVGGTTSCLNSSENTGE